MHSNVSSQPRRSHSLETKAHCASADLPRREPASKGTYRHFADGGLLQQELQVVDLLGGGRRVRGRDQVGRRRHQLQQNSELVHILLSAN